MKKSDWQYILGSLIFLCFIGMVFTGFLIGVVISRDARTSEIPERFLGLHPHHWENIFFYLSIAFVVLSIVHLALSWNWIKVKARQLFHRGWALMLVLTMVVFLLALFLLWTFSPRAPRSYGVYGEKAGSDTITGQMTLLDVEKATGIPAKKIADALGLPPEIPLDETLRQQGKKYDFDIQVVRDCVLELLYKKKVLDQKKKEAEESHIKKEQEIKIKEKVGHKERLQREAEQRLVRGRMAAVPSGFLITGKMTLYDLEDITGIPAREIADELGIPSNAPLNEHLGGLRKRYLFSMHEVRNVVTSLMEKKRKIKK